MKIKDTLFIIGCASCGYIVVAAVAHTLSNLGSHLSFRGLHIIQPEVLEDIFSWGAVEAVGTVLAFFMTSLSIVLIRRQLRVEQEPFVVVEEVSTELYAYSLTIKNIGRGPALDITGSISKDKKNKDDAFFQNNQPHSQNLSSGEHIGEWRVDANRIDNWLAENEGYRDNGKKVLVFYRFFLSWDLK